MAPDIDDGPGPGSTRPDAETAETLARDPGDFEDDEAALMASVE